MKCCDVRLRSPPAGKLDMGNLYLNGDLVLAMHWMNHNVWSRMTVIGIQVELPVEIARIKDIYIYIYMYRYKEKLWANFFK